MFDPDTASLLRNVGLLQAHGRCYTWDHRAKGIVFGEAVVAVTITTKEPKEMQVCAVTVRQDGRTAVITAPNGRAQQQMYRDSLQRANKSVYDLMMCALHGTGTSLGDPIEAGSLTQGVFSTSDESRMVTGLKANTGHTGAAGGLVALLLLYYDLSHCKGHPHAQLRRLNAGVQAALNGTAPQLPTAPTPHKPKPSAVGGVSSFGWSGTIVHGILHKNHEHPENVSLDHYTFRRRSFAFGPAISSAVQARPVRGTSEKKGKKKPTGTAVTAKGPSAKTDVSALVEQVQQEIKQVIEASHLDNDSPLMEAGIDSLASTELSARLSKRFGIAVSPTLVFEQTTRRAIAAHLSEVLSEAPESATAVTDESSFGIPNLEATLKCDGVIGRWPGGCDHKFSRQSLQNAAGDAMSEVPLARWVLEAEVDLSTLSAKQASCVRHGGFLANVQLFDAPASGISPAEAVTADPQQRLLLEYGYLSLHATSHRRALLMDSDTGVFVAIERPDWSLAQPPSARTSVYAGTGDNVSVAAGRVSFVLGLQGPCTSIDTACSAALAAMHAAANATVLGDTNVALTLAVSMKFVPHLTIGAAGAGLLSIDGRCKTLDARANGYARSEGAGALVLRLSDEDDTEGRFFLRGSAIRQDGRSASLTAPNGSAQRILVAAAIGRAGLRPAEIGLVEAHGTGTPLGDPTEAGGLAALHAAGHESAPLAVSAAKANVGHSEGAAGQVGLLRLLHIMDSRNVAGLAQLCKLNPLVNERLGINADKFCLSMHSAVAPDTPGGVSSFGYSGTIGHAVLSLDSSGECPSELLPQLAYQRKAYVWGPVHPFAQRSLPTSEIAETGALTFLSPARGALHALATNHVVLGRVVFPGTGYLEMARASGAPATSLSESVFLQPLAAETPGLLVECVVAGAGRFEVRSGDGSQSAQTEVHCMGALISTYDKTRWDHVSLRALKVAHAAHVGTLYDGFDAVGLQYGPDYRTLEHVWSGKAHAFARLRARASQEGTHVHPADLDDAGCALATTGGSDGETRLPFALEIALLQRAPGVQWAVRHLTR